MGVLSQAFYARVLVAVLIVCFNYFIEDYDSSVHLVRTMQPGSHVPNTWVGRTLAGFAKWDALFFLQIAHEGYLFEKNHAFFPGYPLAIRGLGAVFSYFLPFLSRDEVYLISAVVISWGSWLVSVYYLEKLTQILFRDGLFAKSVCLMYVFNPATVFLASIYSESLFSCFSILGIYLIYRNGFEEGKRGIWIRTSIKNRFLASAVFLLATATRSNGSLLYIFQVFVSLNDLINRYLAKKLTFRSLVSHFFILLLTGVIHASPIFAVLINGYLTYCKNIQSPYCSSIFPNIYSYVQQKYWNVRFLQYWEVKQIPNFCLAFPMIYLSLSCIVSYVKSDFLKFFTFGAVCVKKQQHHYLHSAVSPFILYWAVNLFILIFIANTQIITRTLCSLPALYWFICRRSVENNAFVLLFFVVYFFVGIDLFTNFYPWT